MTAEADPIRQSDPVSHGRVSTEAILLLGFMWFAYFLNYCDRQAVFAMFPSLQSDLGMTDQQLGLTGAYFLWVYALHDKFELSQSNADSMPRFIYKAALRLVC